MKLTDGYVEELVPSEFPPPDIIRPWIAARYAEFIPDRTRRLSYLWAQAILSRLLTELYLAPGFKKTSEEIPKKIHHFSAGFVDINSHIQEKHMLKSVAFGGSVFVDENNYEPSQEIFFINIGERRFPVVVTYGVFEQHGYPPHPHGGSGTCWVENKARNPSWNKGILTCRHVVSGYSIGNTIGFYHNSSYSAPSKGILAARDKCTLDAAMIEIDSIDWPSPISNLPVAATIAPGDWVQFLGCVTNKLGRVLRIFHDPLYTGNLFGQRIIIDCIGMPGDSGALVSNYNKEGVGIYMGRIPDASRGWDGICQDLNQVKDYFDLDLFI